MTIIGTTSPQGKASKGLRSRSSQTSALLRIPMHGPLKPVPGCGAGHGSAWHQEITRAHSFRIQKSKTGLP